MPRQNWSLSVNDANILYRNHLKDFSNEVKELKRNIQTDPSFEIASKPKIESGPKLKSCEIPVT